MLAYNARKVQHTAQQNNHEFAAKMVVDCSVLDRQLILISQDDTLF